MEKQIKKIINDYKWEICNLDFDEFTEKLTIDLSLNFKNNLVKFNEYVKSNKEQERNDLKNVEQFLNQLNK